MRGSVQTPPPRRTASFSSSSNGAPDLPTIENNETEDDDNRLLDEFGVPSSPLNRLEEVFTDQQVLHNKAIIELTHPVHGNYPVPNIPFRLHGTPARSRGHAPHLGEHTREILLECGLDAGEIQQLTDEGVVTEFAPVEASSSA